MLSVCSNQICTRLDCTLSAVKLWLVAKLEDGRIYDVLGAYQFPTVS